MNSVPYAYVARADCLKKRGVSFWQADAVRAKELLEKMLVLNPHPSEVEEFHETCLSLLNTP